MYNNLYEKMHAKQRFGRFVHKFCIIDQMQSKDLHRTLCSSVRRSTPLFIRCFYPFAVLSPLLLLEALLQQAPIAQLSAYVMAAALLLAMFLFAAAVWKHCQHFCTDQLADAASLQTKDMLLQLLIDALWLLLFFIVYSVIVKIHLFLAPLETTAPLASSEAVSGRLQNPIQLLCEFLGTGPIAVVSLFTLYLQLFTFLVTFYLAYALSHRRFFATYHTLACLFLLIALYMLEQELTSYVKKWIMYFLGGLPKLLSSDLMAAMITLAAIECLLTLAAITIKVYFIKGEYHGRNDKEEKAIQRA